MKKFLLFLAVFVSLAFWACSNDKVAGISTVETENAYLIQFVRGDSLPAAHVVARMRSVDFVRSVEGVDAGVAAEKSEEGSAVDSADAEFFSEFVTDSLGCIRIDSLAVDVATLEVVDAGEGLFKKISAEDIKDKTSRTEIPCGLSWKRREVYAERCICPKVSTMPGFRCTVRIVLSRRTLRVSMRWIRCRHLNMSCVTL